jgi:hypothetical protein
MTEAPRKNRSGFRPSHASPHVGRPRAHARGSLYPYPACARPYGPHREAQRHFGVPRGCPLGQGPGATGAEGASA